MNQRRDAKTDAAEVDLTEARRAADAYLSVALRRLADDDDAMAGVRDRLLSRFDYGDAVPVEQVIEALADHLGGTA
jgi:hypothetical protein